MQKSIFPPPCFGMVEEHLYRSAIATVLNFEFLKTLNLKSVLVLSKSAINSQFDSFLKEGNVRKIVIDHSENSNESSDSREGSNDGNINYLISSADGHKLVTQAICVLLDKRNYPLLICCATGKYMTGLIVGCLRRIQKWSMISIYEEYRRFASVKLQLQLPVEQFIELFDVDVFASGMKRPEDTPDGIMGGDETAGDVPGDGGGQSRASMGSIVLVAEGGEQPDLVSSGTDCSKSVVTFAPEETLTAGAGVSQSLQVDGSGGALVSATHLPDFIRRGIKRP